MVSGTIWKSWLPIGLKFCEIVLNSDVFSFPVALFRGGKMFQVLLFFFILTLYWPSETVSIILASQLWLNLLHLSLCVGNYISPFLLSFNLVTDWIFVRCSFFASDVRNFWNPKKNFSSFICFNWNLSCHRFYLGIFHSYFIFVVVFYI